MYKCLDLFCCNVTLKQISKRILSSDIGNMYIDAWSASLSYQLINDWFLKALEYSGWEQFNQNVISSTPAMSVIRTHNISGDIQSLHR